MRWAQWPQWVFLKKVWNGQKNIILLAQENVFPKLMELILTYIFFKVVTFSRKLLRVNFSKKPIQCLNKQIEIKMLN